MKSFTMYLSTPFVISTNMDQHRKHKPILHALFFQHTFSTEHYISANKKVFQVIDGSPTAGKWDPPDI
jgi:hypothetical protein